MSPVSGIAATWCRDRELARKAAEFFVANVDASNYASPSDFIDGRMDANMDGWAPDFAEALAKEFENTAADNEHRRLAVASAGDEIVAIAIAVVAVSTRGSWCMIEDFVVRSDLRKRGLGRSFQKWMETSMSRRGVRHVFIEVSSRNPGSIAFATENGFKACGLLMHKTLQPPPDDTPAIAMKAVQET